MRNLILELASSVADSLLQGVFSGIVGNEDWLDTFNHRKHHVPISLDVCKVSHTPQQAPVWKALSSAYTTWVPSLDASWPSFSARILEGGAACG